MELEEKITAIERMLDQLSKPPEDIPNCEVVIERVCCEKHGEYEQRKRILTSSIINLPSPPTRCPGCLEDELNFLKDEKVRWDKRVSPANCRKVTSPAGNTRALLHVHSGQLQACWEGF